MAQILLNVISVSFIETRLLKNITIVPGTGVFLNYWRNFQSLPVVGLAHCEIVSKIENNCRLFTTTLNAALTEHFDVQDRQLAYLLTCVNGDRYLVGTSERPCPISNTADSLPGNITDPSGCTLNVEFTDSFGLMPVLDWF